MTSDPMAFDARPLVVIVDDDAAVRGALKFALELEGFRVDTCESGEALLARPLPQGAACVVIDQRLAGVDGLETLRRLRERGDHLPALLITSHPQLALRAAALAAGVPIVEKPLMGHTLRDTIRRVLGRAGP
jgi:FixJ family two-component response regulator